MVLTPDQLYHVNAAWLGQKYKDKQAAIKKRGTVDKQPLTTSRPFVLEFEYGVSAEGYWTNDSRVLQLEDCADVVAYTTLYPIEIVEEFEYLGRIVMKRDKDEPAVMRNLAQARAKWASMRRFLVRDAQIQRQWQRSTEQWFSMCYFMAANLGY
jgi:hypothetical protein